jgi:hypothetical protein
MDAVPQAVIEVDIADLIVRHPEYAVDDVDGLNHFSGLRFSLNNSVPAAVLCYDGFPAGTATIYFDINVTDVAEITALVDRVVAALDIGVERVLWQRHHGENSPEWDALVARR